MTGRDLFSANVRTLGALFAIYGLYAIGVGILKGFFGIQSSSSIPPISDFMIGIMVAALGLLVVRSGDAIASFAYGRERPGKNSN